MSSKQDEVKKAIAGIPLGDQDQEPEAEPEKKKETKPYHTITVGLTDEELTEVEAIAAELGQARHAILKYAVLDFVRRYKEGQEPEYETVKVLKTST